jgi:hypothetical protein
MSCITIYVKGNHMRCIHVCKGVIIFFYVLSLKIYTYTICTSFAELSVCLDCVVELLDPDDWSLYNFILQSVFVL